MDDSKQWLWIGDGTQRGPFSAPALIDLFQQQISLQTQLATLPVWCEGMEEWAKAIDTPPFREHIIALLSMWYCADPGVPGGRVGPFTTRELAVRFADGDLDGLTMLFGQTEHNGWESSGWTALTELPCLKAAITAISSHDDEDEEENEDEKRCVSGVVSEADMVFVGGSAEQQPDLPDSWTEGSGGGGGTSASRGEKQQRPQKRYTADDGTRFSWQPSSSDGGGAGGGGGGEWVEYAGPDEEWEDDGEEGEGDDDDSGGTRQTGGVADGRTSKRPREEEGSRVTGGGGAGGVGGEGGAAATEDLPGEGTTTKKQPLSNAERKEKRERSKRNKKKKAQAGAWNEKSSKNHSWVYVQGLPSDVTSAELAEHFSKCGVLALDPATQNPWVKVYYHPLDETDTDMDMEMAGGEEGTVRGGTTRVGKGDASVCYANADSVPLALQVLDGGRLRANSEPISVTKAEFNLKGGAYDASLHKKVSVAAKKVAKAAAAQALTWAEDDTEAEEQHAGKGSAASLLKIVVLTGLFTLEEIAGDSGQGQGQEHSKSFEEELTKELAGELEEKCGEPEKITLFSKNPKGVVVVKFGSAFAAGLCVKLMQGRFFAGRVLSCTYWDGVTDYTVEEAEEVAEKRVEQFGDWIDEQELPPELQLQVEE